MIFREVHIAMKQSCFTAVLLAVCLLLSGCGNSGTVESGTVSALQTVQQPVSGTVTLPEVPAANSAQDETRTADPVPAEQAEPDFVPGFRSGGVYENRYFGLCCTLDDYWTFLSDAELLKLAGLSIDELDDESLKEILGNSDVIYDMYASADDGLETVNVVIEKLSLLNSTIYDEKSYADAAVEGLEASTAAMGVSDAVIESGTEFFAGAMHPIIRISGTLDGTDVGFFEKVICLKRGSYVCCITCSSCFEDITDTISAAFSAIE